MRVYQSEVSRKLGIQFTAPRDGDAGYDLFSIADYEVPAGKTVLVVTGLHVEIPSGYVGLVKDRSSVASAGLHSLAGVIDSAYRGEIKILLLNIGAATYSIKQGQKIAQMVVLPVYLEDVEQVDTLEDLTDTERGVGGFGSTGKM